MFSKTDSGKISAKHIRFYLCLVASIPGGIHKVDWLCCCKLESACSALWMPLGIDMFSDQSEMCFVVV